jgi:hypothetical protein
MNNKSHNELLSQFYKERKQNPMGIKANLIFDRFVVEIAKGKNSLTITRRYNSDLLFMFGNGAKDLEFIEFLESPGYEYNIKSSHRDWFLNEECVEITLKKFD